MTSPFWEREKREILWLRDHPQFAHRPATIREFVGEDYLNEPNVRPGIMAALVDVFGDEIDSEFISKKRRACITGGIGIGKTTFASIALSYMVHWVSCLKDPQGYFGLAKGSRISFMMMSTSQKQAKEVIFGDVKARINNSPWFQRHCRYDERFENQIRFPKLIWIVPGGSKETQFEGYNILAGILDEGDSHVVTDEKDYAEEGWNTIESRIASRFIDHKNETTKGLIIAIGQMKSNSGFMSRKYKDILDDPDGTAVRMAIWESFGWYNYTENKADADHKIETAPRKCFYFDTQRREVIPALAAGQVQNKFMIQVPTAYAAQFAKDPVKALRDLAGIPPAAEDPFIANAHLIALAQEKWLDRYGKSPLNVTAHDPVLDPGYICRDSLRRAMHIDIAYSAAGDALAFAMGHIPEMVDHDGEVKPNIVIDLVVRMKAKPGTQNSLANVRQMIYDLRDNRKFKIKTCTLDGFNSTDTIQQLNKHRIESFVLSVDRSKAPYEDLRDAVYERRIELPKQMVFLNYGDTSEVDIVYKELSELQDKKNKIDHPPLGSKDCADAIAGVVYTLMDRYKEFGRGASRPRSQEETEMTAGDLQDFLAGKLSWGAPAADPPLDYDTFKKQAIAEQSAPAAPGVKYDAFDLRQSGYHLRGRDPRM